MKILTVDDSMTIRKIITGAASVMGFETVGAGSSEEALSILEREGESFSLVLLDINIPSVSGLELLKIIKANPRWASIPVMMVTSETERKNIIAAIESGAASYLAKPFSPEDLITRIMQCIGQGGGP